MFKEIIEIDNAVRAAKVKFVMELKAEGPVKEVEELSPELSVRALIKGLVDHFGFSRKDVAHYLKAFSRKAVDEGFSEEFCQKVQCYLAMALEVYPFSDDGGPLVPCDGEDWGRIAKICCDAGIPMDTTTVIKKFVELDAWVQAETGEGLGVF